MATNTNTNNMSLPVAVGNGNRIDINDSDDDLGPRSVYMPTNVCPMHQCQIPQINRRLNQLLLIDPEQNDHSSEAYDEIKRLIVFAGIFFLFMIIFVLLKFQVALDDVFKWSPVVWLVGVITCGLVMNLFLQVRKFLMKQMLKRMRQRQELLYSLNLQQNSLASQNNSHCCHHHAHCHCSSHDEVISELLPSYDQIEKGTSRSWLLSAPAYRDQRPTQDELSRKPPNYSSPVTSSSEPIVQVIEGGSGVRVQSVSVTSAEEPSSATITAGTPPPCYEEMKQLSRVDVVNTEEPGTSSAM